MDERHDVLAPLWHNDDSILKDLFLIGEQWFAVAYCYSSPLQTPTLSVCAHFFITSLAISFGSDPYLGNEVVCCACNEENDLKCFLIS